jgi:hypothetical protein
MLTCGLTITNLRPFGLPITPTPPESAILARNTAAEATSPRQAAS